MTPRTTIINTLSALSHSRATIGLISFWSGLPRPGTGVCPKRSDFSSARVNGSLPEIYVSEWQDDETLLVVQSGTVLDRQIGLDMTGKNIFAMTPPEMAADEIAYYTALRRQPCAGMITRHMANFLGRSFIYRTVQLPLLDPFGKVQYFVGTGFVMTEAEAKAEFGVQALENAVIERRFFDIGAGVPAPMKAGGTCGTAHPIR